MAGSYRLPALPRGYRGALSIAADALAVRTAGRADVVIVPYHADGEVYRVQLEDAHGQTSNVAEARVDVFIRPFWRRAQCETPSGESAGDGRQASARAQAVGTRRSEEGSR
jgi:hypothetical protein